MSRGRVKSAVDVLGDMYHASLLHLTKAAVSCLNSFSGHIITGPEKTRRGAKVPSTNLKLFLIHRSLVFRRKHAISVIPSMTYLLWAALSYCMPKSLIGARPCINLRSVPLYLMPFGFQVCWHSRHGGIGVV